MAIYSQALRTTVFTATTTANHQLCLAPATVRPKILEYSYIQLTAVASQIGVGRPQAIAGTPTNVLFQADDPGDPASTCNGAIAWSTSPTVPLIYHRRWNGTLASVGVVWTFPRGLVVPVSSAVVCWNIATTVAADVNVVIDE
jgi:hypothetical protein